MEKIKVEFVFETAERKAINVIQWDWASILSSLSDQNNNILWDTFTLSKESWEQMGKGLY